MRGKKISTSWWRAVLHQCIGAFSLERRAPGHHGYQRACELTNCKIWYSIFQTVSDLGNIYDRSIRAFAVKPRAFGAPLSGFGA